GGRRADAVYASARLDRARVVRAGPLRFAAPRRVYRVRRSSDQSDISVSQVIFSLFDWRCFDVRRWSQQFVAQLLLKFRGDFRVVRQELGRVGLALTDLGAFVGIPGTGLLYETVQNTQVDHLTVEVDALAVKNLELGLAERRSDLILHNLDAGFTTDDFITFFHRASTADVQTNRRIELQRVTTG